MTQDYGDSSSLFFFWGRVYGKWVLTITLPGAKLMVEKARADAEDHRDEDEREDNPNPDFVHELVVLQLLLQLIHAAAVEHHMVAGKVQIHVPADAAASCYHLAGVESLSLQLD